MVLLPYITDINPIYTLINIKIELTINCNAFIDQKRPI